MTGEERTGIVVELTAKGMSCAKIAAFAKCSAPKVNRIQRSLNIQRSRGSEKNRPTRAVLLGCNGMTAAEICVKFNRGHDTVSNWLRHYGIARAGCGPRVGQLIDVVKLRELAARGLSASQIAVQIGTEEIVVSHVAHRAGIELPTSDQQPASVRTKRYRSRAECTRPIAGSTSPRAINRALAKLERRA